LIPVFVGSNPTGPAISFNGNEPEMIY